jgi:hypothetical protein
LNLFTSLIAMADINDDIQRKQAQDRRQLELEKSLKEQYLRCLVEVWFVER